MYLSDLRGDARIHQGIISCLAKSGLKIVSSHLSAFNYKKLQLLQF